MSVNFKKSYLKNLDFVFCKKNIICNCYAIFKNPLLEQIRLWKRIRSGPYLEAGGPQTNMGTFDYDDITSATQWRRPGDG